MSENKGQLKHVAMRMCIVTKIKLPKSDLMRLVRIGDDKVIVDPTGKARGRGANISMDLEVFEKAVKRGMIERALKIKRKLIKEEVENLRSAFKEGIELKNFRKGNKPVVIKVKKEELEKVIKA